MQEMAVTNINMQEWKPEYTRGLSTMRRGHSSVPSDSQYIWELCKNIFNKYQAFGDMPVDLTEQRWIGDNGVGFGTFSPSYENALWKLKKILRWMQNPKTTIRVGWNVGRTWEVGTHVLISVPHIKGGFEFLCVIESIAKSRHGNNPNVSCELIILDNLGFEKILPEILFFHSNLESVMIGRSIALYWAVEDAIRVEIDGIGVVESVGNLAPIFPTDEPITTFTLIATHASGGITIQELEIDVFRRYPSMLRGQLFTKMNIPLTQKDGAKATIGIRGRLENKIVVAPPSSDKLTASVGLRGYLESKDVPIPPILARLDATIGLRGERRGGGITNTSSDKLTASIGLRGNIYGDEIWTDGVSEKMDVSIKLSGSLT